MTNSFQNIIAWQKAYDYCLLVYKSTENFPDFESSLHIATEY